MIVSISITNENFKQIIVKKRPRLKSLGLLFFLLKNLSCQKTGEVKKESQDEDCKGGALKIFFALTKPDI